jgi:glycine C-acetyltransferase
MEDTKGTKFPTTSHLTIQDEEKIDLSDFNINAASINQKASTPLDRSKVLGKIRQVVKNSAVMWPTKTALSAPTPVSAGSCNIRGVYFSGINLATQDYMSMCRNPDSIKVVEKVLREQGTHSGGTPKMLGYSKYHEELIQTVEWYFDELFGESRSHQEIGAIRRSRNNGQVRKAHAKIFSTGWLAGYSAVAGMVQQSDYVVMDALSHNCLKEGAKASKATVINHKHLDIDDFERVMNEIRSKDSKNSILVVTESLFSMDSDNPDLVRMQKICYKHGATLLIDSAHDMYGTGKTGRGLVSEQLTDYSNVVIIGSGSKCLASNFGYLVCGNKSLVDMLDVTASAWAQSDALPPAMAAMISHNIKVMGSKIGDEKRACLRRNEKFILKRLEEEGFETIGFPSPIVIVFIGSELISRSIANFMYEEGMIVNSVEYPAVDQGHSRLRLQLQAGHTIQMLEDFVQKLVDIQPKIEHFLETDKLAQAISLKIVEEMQKKAQEQQQARL